MTKDDIRPSVHEARARGCAGMRGAEAATSVERTMDFTFLHVPAGDYALGLDVHSLPPHVVSELDAFIRIEEVAQRYSPPRRAALASFDIASEAVLAESFLDLDGDEAFDRATTLAMVCDAIDARLLPLGLRLPTEDEFEALAGPARFPWGDELPTGIPYGDETTFEAHRVPRADGFVFNHDPYRWELTRSALKAGDGGEAICGGYPSPFAWLPLARAHRLTGEEHGSLAPEFMETCLLRPVRLSHDN